MRENNYVAWLKMIAVRPNVLAIFLRSLFDAKAKADSCECLEKGIMFLPGNINRCLSCTDLICKLDSHLFLGSVSTAVIGWLSLVLEGIYQSVDIFN